MIVVFSLMFLQMDNFCNHFNLPTIILMIKTIFDMGSICTEVIPEDDPVVVNTVTETKSESKKFSLYLYEI